MLTRFTEELNNFAQEILEQYKSNLESNHGSSNLADTATFTVTVNDNDFMIEFDLQDYWIYVENGRSPGKFPPPDAILSWIRSKPVIPREINDKLPTEEQLSFLIGRHIANNGTQGTHDFEDAKNTIISRYESILSEALQEDYNEEATDLISQSSFFNI